MEINPNAYGRLAFGLIICMCICVCIYTHTHTCVCVCVCVCVYVPYIKTTLLSASVRIKVVGVYHEHACIRICVRVHTGVCIHHK